MLANRMFFWSDADWILSSNFATAISFTGPASGYIDQPSSNFQVGANGSISGVLVVTVALTSGTGALSQSVFSLSTGAATGTFFYTPSTLGNHILVETNSQGLTDAASLTYAVSVVPIQDTTSGGGGGHAKEEFYFHADEEFWTVRERYLQNLRDKFSYKTASSTAVMVHSPGPTPNELTTEVPTSYHLDRYVNELSTSFKLASESPNYFQLEKTSLRIKELSTAITSIKRKIAVDNHIRATSEAADLAASQANSLARLNKRRTRLAKLQKALDTLQAFASRFL